MHATKQAAESRQNMVEIFVDQAELRQTMQEHFKRITDIDRLIKKFQRKRITATLKVTAQSFSLHCSTP